MGTIKKKKVRLDFVRKHLKRHCTAQENIIWRVETDINLYHNDGKRKIWRRRAARDPKHTASSVKHVKHAMAWACMAVTGTTPIVFIDDVTADRRSIRVNYKVYRAMLSAQISPNAAKPIKQSFTVQTDNDLKFRAKETQEFLKVKKDNILQDSSQSPD